MGARPVHFRAVFGSDGAGTGPFDLKGVVERDPSDPANPLADKGLACWWDQTLTKFALAAAGLLQVFFEMHGGTFRI